MTTEQAFCPFCTPEPDRIILSNERAVAIRDGFPISKGHTLIIPKRHIASLFEATAGEQAALLELLTKTRQQLQDELRRRKIIT